MSKLKESERNRLISEVVELSYEFGDTEYSHEDLRKESDKELLRLKANLENERQRQYEAAEEAMRPNESSEEFREHEDR